jgi:repressor LexA
MTIPDDSRRSKPGDSPTPRQAQIYTLVLRHFAEHGSPPTIREIGAAAGITSPNGVVVNLVALHKKGLIVFRQTGAARGIVVPPVAEATKEAAAKLLAKIKQNPIPTEKRSGRPSAADRPGSPRRSAR